MLSLFNKFGGAMEYTIEVDVIVARCYTVEADSPEEAMTIYHAGGAQLDEGEMFEANWDEQLHTAHIVMTEVS
jgi:hypothetical protein